MSQDIDRQIAESIDAQVAERLKAERQRVAGEESKKAAEAVATEMTDLRQQLDDKASKLDEAQRNELELRKQRRDLEERQKQMQLEIERKLDAERKAIRESTQKKVAEEHRLKEAEKEQQLTAMRKQNNRVLPNNPSCFVRNGCWDRLVGAVL